MTLFLVGMQKIRPDGFVEPNPGEYTLIDAAPDKATAVGFLTHLVGEELLTELHAHDDDISYDTASQIRDQIRNCEKSLLNPSQMIYTNHCGFASNNGTQIFIAPQNLNEAEPYLLVRCGGTSFYWRIKEISTF